MREALGSRHAVALWIVAAVGGVVTGAASGVDLDIPFVPRVLHSSLPFPLLAAVVLAVVAMGVSRAGEPSGARSLVRRVEMHSTAVVAAAVAVFACAATATLGVARAPVGESVYLVVTAATVLLVTLTARGVSSSTWATSLPLLYLVAVTLFGRGPSGEIGDWAWLVSRSWWIGNTGLSRFAFATLAVCCVVAAAWLISRRPLLGAAQDAPRWVVRTLN